MTLTYTHAIDALSTILENQGLQELTGADLYHDSGLPMFDAILFKKLKKWSIIDENAVDKKTRDSDIRFEGSERNIFPIYENLLYKEKNEGKGYFKKFYMTKLPIYLLQENVRHMFLQSAETSFKMEDLEQFSIGSPQHTHITKEARNSERIFLGYKDQDSKGFTDFRKLLFEDDYLIICKSFGKNEFTFIGAKEDDLVGTGIDHNRSSFFHLESGKTKINTSVDVSDTSEFFKFDASHPHQRMIVGAPGIGKSFFVKDESLRAFKPENITTVTFYQNQKYSKFIGAYKPTPSDSVEGGIEYSFQPGLFLSRLVDAMKNPTEPHLFIIEEINRGEANEIFGGFFQLLERQSDGRSRYLLDVEPDILRYLKKENVFVDGKIYLPPNFYLWATCNLNDQHTMSMDNSFLRRWDRTFIHMDHFEAGATFNIKLPSFDEAVPWNVIRRKINDSLMEFPYIQEDQLLGPFFIQNDQDEEEFFSNIIVHLKENVMGEMAEELFVHKFLSKLYDKYKKGEKIFSTFDWNDLFDETSN